MKGLRPFYPSDLKLDKKKTVSIHQKNLQIRATEIFKAKLNISREVLTELFSFNVGNHNLRSQPTLAQIKTNSVYFGRETISSLAPKIWKLVTDNFKNEV